MTTAGDLVDRARSFDRDMGGSFIQEDDYLNWCNEAQTDLIARQQLMEQEASATADGTDSLEFPTTPDLIQILDLVIGDDDRVEFVPSPTFDQLVDGDITPVPSVARIFDDHIQMYPTPASGTTVLIRYKRLPTPITEASDTIEIPAQLERKVVEYMKAQSRFKDGDFVAGNNWLALYEQGLEPVSIGREKFSAGPMNFQLQPSWFDQDARVRRGERA